MKKLMIAAAIVCAAALSQAASVQWTAANIATVATQGTDNPELLGGAKYFCFLSQDTAGVWEKTISVDDAVSLVKAKNWSELEKYALTSKTTTAAGGVSSDKVAGWAKGNDRPYGFVIILDTGSTDTAANYMVTSTAQASAFSQDSTTAKIALGSQAANTWQSIPEPTSGLLLLLGVAGLALRRRRA